MPQKLTQRRAVIALAKQRRQRMLVGIECREFLDPQQGGKKQGLKAAQKRLLAVMQQGKVIARMRLLISARPKVFWYNITLYRSKTI